MTELLLRDFYFKKGDVLTPYGGIINIKIIRNIDMTWYNRLYRYIFNKPKPLACRYKAKLI